MLSYPHRTDAQEAALNRLNSTAYATEDKPFLFTERYSLSADYDPSDVVAKRQVDLHGAMDNFYWMQKWKENSNV